MTCASIICIHILNFNVSFECCAKVYSYGGGIMEFELEG
jgi:hypothetical protein